MNPQTLDSTTKRHTTNAQRLLRRGGVTLTGIARATNKPTYTVRRALALEHFAGMAYRDLLPVRRQVEALAPALGWEKDPAELWAEYDKHIDNHRAT